jgi:hypothetical protein
MRGRRWLGRGSLLLGLGGVWLLVQWRGEFALWMRVGMGMETRAPGARRDGCARDRRGDRYVGSVEVG